MANLIQATVYQIDGSPLPSASTFDFQTSNIVIREAIVPTIAAVQSAILYYNVPNNSLSVQTFFVSETIADLVAASNVSVTTQVQATVLEINEDPQVPGGVQYSFPANEILVGESINAVTGVNAYIQFKNVKYFVSETQSDILLYSNLAGSGIQITKSELDLLVASNDLVPSATYIISGVDTPLYGGTTIIIKAATTNKLELAGHGVFYNPKYINLQAPNNGYGIWQSGNTYAIGDDAIWGGKHWTNKTGVAGSSVDKYTLDSTNWDVVAFNSTDYNVVSDVIHYDQEHDMIIRRKDKWDNDVDGNYLVFIEFSDYNGSNLGNPIKDFQWGNGPEGFNTSTYYYRGVFSNYVKDSYLECINFIGDFLSSNTLTQFSKIHSNIIDYTSSISSNNLESGSAIHSNTITQTSGITGNNLHFYSSIAQNQINDSVYVVENVLNSTSNISVNQLSSSASIRRNTLNSQSTIYGNILSNVSSISSNILSNSIFGFGYGTLSGKTIENIEANYANATFNISAATIIYGDYSKQMFRNSAGTTRLAYYNASSVLTVVNVNA